MTDARGNVIASYRARRSVLLHEAAVAETTHRTDRARMARDAALLVSKAISDEILDEKPSGLGTFDDLETLP